MEKLTKLFEKHGTITKIKKGRMLFGVDDPPTKMFLVKSGAAKIFRYTDEGKEVMIDIIGPGSLATITPYLRGSQHVASAETLVDSEIYWLPLGQFRTLVQNDPETMGEIASLLARKWDEFADRVEAFVTLNSLGRLSYIILELADKYGIEEKNIIRLPFPLTHQDLANLTGMFRETVSLSLQQLKKIEAISTEKQILHILKKPLLEKTAKLVSE